MPKAILTFDDGFRSHFEIVKPILEQYGLQATFYICGGFIEHPSLIDTFMNWEQVKALSEANFEIGNHLYHHVAMTDKNFNQVRDIQRMEEKLQYFQIKKANTLAYPGYHIDNEAIKLVKSLGYSFARAGCEKTLSFDDFQAGAAGSYFNYAQDNPYNINCAGIFGDNFGVNEFKHSLDGCDDNSFAVYCFHSFSGHSLPEMAHIDISVIAFEECMKYLADNSIKTLRVCDIEDYLT